MIFDARQTATMIGSLKSGNMIRKASRMKVIIDVKSEMWDWLVNGFPDEEDGVRLLDIVKNGTPLPEGHGRLVDMSEVLIKLMQYYDGDKTLGQCIDDTPTILEASEG